MSELRYYQIEAKQSVLKDLSKGVKDLMLVMATGTGKTFTACNIIKDFNRCLWLTHTEELISQSAVALLLSQYEGDTDVLKKTMQEKRSDGSYWFSNFIEFTAAVNEYQNSTLFTDPENPLQHIDCEQIYNLMGIIKRERMDLHAKIVVASIQTINRRLDKIDPKTFDIIVVDECHQSAAKTWKKTIDYFDYKLNLGLTATPHRSDNMSLGNIYDKISYEYDILTAINDGFLCELDAIQIKTNINLDSVRTLAGEFNQEDLKIVDNPVRNKLIVDKYKEYSNDRQFIVSCVNVQHAVNLCEEFNKQAIHTSFVVGDESLCPDRTNRIRRFKNGEIIGLTNVMVLVMGFDHPEVACIIHACPTKSLTKYIQITGRGTRLKKTFKTCMILDVVDVSSKHSLVNTWELDKAKSIEDKVFKTKEQKEKMLEDLAKKRKIEGNVDKDKKINLFDIPAVKVWDTERTREPATEKQLAWIARLGYDTVNVEYTKAMCIKIIGNLPARESDIDELKRMGFKIHDGLTQAEADAAKNEDYKRIHGKYKWQVEREQRAMKPFLDL